MESNNLKNKITLVVLGRSGSGKGTQARFILQKLGRKNSRHMETGRFFRKLIEKSNPTILLARRLIMQGKFPPFWFAVYTWLKEFIEKGMADKHLVFDGAPRRFREAEILDDVMKWYNRPLPICVYLDVGVGEVTKRLLGRGRADDSPAVIRSRLQSFEKDSLPVLDYYRKMGRLIRIDGEGGRKEIAERINRALAKKLGKSWLGIVK